MKGDINGIQYNVMQVKSLTNLIIKLLEDVKGKEIPEDPPELRETLHTLAFALSEKAQHLDELVSEVKLPSTWVEKE
jgi:hypothetical protein